jgi:pyrroline-5-carboxylate reductase
MNIGFIGAGNMGGAILRGCLAGKEIQPEQIYVTDPDQEKLSKLREELGISPCGDIRELTRKADLIFIGVKPGVFDQVLPEMADLMTSDKLIVSMAAGISIAYISRFLGENTPVVRIMPNTPAMVGEGMTAVCRNEKVTEEAFSRAFHILESIGRACEVEEEQIHTVIGVSGSSPAYTYMYIDALAKSAEAGGLSRENSLLFAAQAVLGAAKMVLETGIDPEQLRINVCSPGGTTIEAVKKLQENGFEEKVMEGFRAAAEKSRQMEKK